MRARTINRSKLRKLAKLLLRDPGKYVDSFPDDIRFIANSGSFNLKKCYGSGQFYSCTVTFTLEDDRFALSYDVKCRFWNWEHRLFEANNRTKKDERIIKKKIKELKKPIFSKDGKLSIIDGIGNLTLNKQK